MRLFLSLALVAIVLSKQTPAADENPANAERIARLISQLGSKDFGQRDAAERMLDGVGAAALPPLRDAAASSKDPEIRRRAESLIAAIETRLRLPKEFAATMTQAVELVHGSFIYEVHRGELAALAIRGLFDALGEKVPAEIGQRLPTANKLNDADRSSLLFDARFTLGIRGDLADKQDLHHAIAAMIRGIDLHGDYIDPVEFQRDLIGNFTGIGAELEIDPATQMPRVLTPIKDGPAHKAGICAGDHITHITRREDATGRPLNPPEVIATKGRPLSEIVIKLLGQPTSRVEVTIQRAGEAQPLVFVLARAAVTVETVLGVQRRADAGWDYLIDKEKRIGYVRLKQFSRDSAKDLKNAVDAMEKDGLKGLILDLRFNPGGLLAASVEIADLFINDEEIVGFSTRSAKIAPYKGMKEGSRLTFPMVCLVNGSSASASEIVAACLQDHKRAAILGERSKGKGSVQNLMAFAPTGREIKLTTAILHRPNGGKLDRMKIPGRDADEWGVTPARDQLRPLPDAERTELEEHLKRLSHILPANQQPNIGKAGFTDRQLTAALEYLRSRS